MGKEIKVNEREWKELREMYWQYYVVNPVTTDRGQVELFHAIRDLGYRIRNIEAILKKAGLMECECCGQPITPKPTGG